MPKAAPSYPVVNEVFQAGYSGCKVKGGLRIILLCSWPKLLACLDHGTPRRYTIVLTGC